MNRRGFLSLFGIGAAVAAIDPERLLWTPGRKLVSIPAARVATLGERFFRIPIVMYKGGSFAKYSPRDGDPFRRYLAPTTYKWG